MKTTINHSGAVNRYPRFTLEMSEISHATISVNGNSAYVRFEATEDELHSLIDQASKALEQCRLRKRFDDGELDRGEYNEARHRLAKP